MSSEEESEKEVDADDDLGLGDIDIKASEDGAAQMDDFDIDEIDQSINEANQEGLDVFSKDQDEEFTSFEAASPGKMQEDLYKDDRHMEQTSHEFGFSQAMIEDYAAVLENRIDFGQKITTEEATLQESDEEDIDFVGNKPLEEELAGLDKKIGDLESLNLFGVSIDRTAEDIAKDLSGRKKQDKMRMKNILNDLVTMARELDP